MAERRIAVDVRPLCHPGTGICRYTRELLTRLCRAGGEWFLYSPQRYDPGDLDLPNVHHRNAGLTPALRASQLAHALYPLWLRRDAIDAFWGPRHQLPPLVPPRVRTVVTLHDLVFRDCADTMRFPGRQIEDFFTPRALARADVIAVVSNFTRDRLRHHFPQFAAKATVVPGAGVLRRGVNGPPAVEHGYFLFVGTLEPRKNLPRLLRAYRHYVDRATEPRRLKIVGGDGWGGVDIAALTARLGLGERVERLGRVDEAALGDIYRAAHALVMPSLYEGFGLPVAEALAAGIPVITSRDSAMAEVAGSAALCVDPQSETAIAEALERVGHDAALHAALRSAAPLESRRHDWDDSALAMAGLLMS